MIFKDFVGYKYVRLSTDEFRFTEAILYGKTHKDLVKEGETAISAGIIMREPDRFVKISEGGTSLNIIWSKESDFPLLEKITGRKFEGRNF